MCHRDSTTQRPAQALEVADIFQIPLDLVVRYQVVDIVEVIFSLIWRGTII
jgi:hypothetical protein